MLKDTSLLAVVTVTELTREAQFAAANSSAYLPLYLLAGLYYWVVCVGMSAVQGRLETRLNRFVAR